MALQLTTAILDLISRLALGTSFSNATSDNQAMLSGGASLPTASPGGVCGLAMNIVQPYAIGVGYSGAAGVPDAWVQWFVVESVSLFMDAVKPDQSGVWARRASRQMQAALDAIPGAAVDTATVQASAVSVQGIRQYVLGHCARLSGGRRRLMPSIVEIDAQIESAFLEIWKGANWTFRRRPVTMSIASDGAVSFNLGSGLTACGSATRQWYYLSEGGFLTQTTLRWAGPDEFSAALARDGTTTGRPVLLRVDPLASGLQWRLWPSPDKAYTLKGEVFIDAPEMPSGASGSSDTTAFMALPREFRPLLRDLTLARVLKALGAEDQRKFDDVMDQLRTLAPQYQDVGAIDNNPTISDRYEDAGALGNPWGLGGRM